MFVDFNRVFSDKPQTELKIPDALVNHLNMNLPTGIKYVVDSKGNCRITTEGDSVVLGGWYIKRQKSIEKFWERILRMQSRRQLCALRTGAKYDLMSVGCQVWY